MRTKTLVELLQFKKTREDTRALIRETRELLASLSGISDTVLFNTLADPNIHRIFIAPQLLPCVVTAADVSSALFHIIPSPTENDFEETYARFSASLIESASWWRRTDILCVGRGHDLLPQSFVSEDSPQGLLIWTSDSGISVHLVGVLPGSITTQRETGKSQGVHVSITGCASDSAFNAAQFELFRVLKSLFSLCMVVEDKVQEIENNIANEKPRESSVAIVKEGRLNGCFGNVPAILRAYFDSSKKVENSISARLRTATRMIVEAAQPIHHSVSLALTVAAMESLLCCDDSGVSEKVARCFGVLLEPKLEYRRAAEQYIGDLYHLRSRVLHGDSLEIDESDVRRAHRVAAAVLFAMTDLMRHNGEERIDVVLQQMKDQRTEGQPLGVQVSPVCMLWRDPEAFDD